MTTLIGHALRAIRSHTIALAAALTLFATPVIFSSSHAQTVPTSCRPNTGAPYDCSSSVPSPYYYYAGTCAATGAFASESAAFAQYRTAFASLQCPVSFLLQGWVNPGPKYEPTDFSVACSGGNGAAPGSFYSREQNNWLLEKVTREFGPAPACGNPHDTVWGAVQRGRMFACQEGSSWFTSDVCYRVTAQLDHAKNYGQSCPPNGQCMTGQPINLGAKNKFRAERDYSSSSNSPLSFTRYYNSLPMTASFSHLYRDASYEAVAGPASYSSISSEPSEQGGRFAALAVGVVGVGWRHTYQRSIARETTTLLTSAFAFRPDGQVLAFTKMSGQWYAQADVTMRLEEVVDAGGIQTGWKMTLANDNSVETFDLTGRLTSIRSRAQVLQTLAYDSCGRLNTVTDSFGNLLSFGYGTGCGVGNAQRISSVTIPGGGVYGYGYDSTGRLTSVTSPNSTTRQYHYENAAYKLALTGITDESGQRYATFGYDSEGRPILSELAGGAEHIGVTYPDGTVITTGLGASVTYTFKIVQGISRLNTQSAYCIGCPVNAKSMTYDVNGNVSISKDFKNVETRYTNDLTRNLETSRTEAYGTSKARTITTTWHSTFRLPTQIDEPGKRTTFTHDSNGNVLTKTVLDTSTSASRTWTYTYNSIGQVLTANGPRTDVSDVTTYTYYTCTTGYECGQLHTATNALSHVTTYNTYNAHGQPLTITDPNGVVTTLTYDTRQRLTSRTVGSEQTTFDYWPTGLLKKATLPDGSFIEYTYDAAHRLTRIEDSEGNHIVYTLDAMGNRTAEQLYDPSSALTQTRTHVFNTLNQLWKEIGAAGTSAVTTSFSYDDNGNQIGINAPLSRNTTQAYDELNRLKQITDPLSGVTQYGYNAIDQLISVTDPRSKVTNYTYNALGDLTQQVSPDTGTTANTYDSGGNLATSTDARSKTGTYAYDALNRVTSVTYPDQTISYTYDTGTDQKGRLTQLTDASGSTSWSYDTHGRVLSRQQSMGVTKTLGYSYDSSGRVQTLTLPSGNTVGYGYTDGKVTSLTLNGSTTILSNVLYQPFGPTQGWTWGNSTLAIREYDTDGKITDIDSSGLKTYSYDVAFRITGITDASNSSLSQSYGYDLLDRVTSATGTSLSQGWTYDANGNRLTQTGSAASTYTVSGTSNRLSGVSGALARAYSYDNAGNTTGDGSATFTYNDAGRMTGATKSSVTTSYALNALGQRVKKTATGSSTYFAYDEAGHLVGEYDNSGILMQETVWFGDTSVATLRPNGGGVNLFYVHTDHLNTPRRISRPSDNVIIWRWDGDPFGTTTANQDPDGDSTLFVYNLRFPGQFLDAETGLHYNYFRDGYDPATARYTQSDPMLQPNRLITNELAFYVPLILQRPQWLQPYSYVTAKPLSEIDPYGLGLWGIIKCMWYGSKMEKYADQCQGECPNDMMGQLNFMRKYQAGFLEDAMLKCTCSKAEAAGDKDLCARFFATCITSPFGGPMPGPSK